LKEESAIDSTAHPVVIGDLITNPSITRHHTETHIIRGSKLMISRCVSANALLQPAVEGAFFFAFWEIFLFCEHARLIDANGTSNEAAKRYLSMKQSG
jgi:hypothetical protein